MGANSKEDKLESEGLDFIRSIVRDDHQSGIFGRPIKTRFPPEPSGYLHLGHAKSICLNFGIAEEFKDATCNLRFDDTNPLKEESEFVESMREDLHWLGFDWGKNETHASEYFEQFYNYAVQLIQNEKAYVCSLSNDEMREGRGTLSSPGKNSPYRDRSIDENLKLFSQMKSGHFSDGDHVLRAKIDMSSPNLNMRDPVLYRIRHQAHHRTGNKWYIYPMYDYAHCISDAIEGITHSLCTLEFEDHRPLYEWILNSLSFEKPPRQIEFARLNLSYTVLGKRKLRSLVDKQLVQGWNDPRMPTLAGIRRRGFTPESLKLFSSKIGIAKADNTVDLALLNFCLREDLNSKAKRVMGVLNPLKLVITNYPKNKIEELPAENNPEDPSAGSRNLPFSRELYIEADDFCEDPPKKWFRLSPGKEVRLKHAYYITCTEVIKDPTTGEITELHCTYDPATRGGWSEDKRKVKGTLHWVSVSHAFNAEVRLFDNLFLDQQPDKLSEEELLNSINPDSLKILTNCKLEPSLLKANKGEHFQFLRLGYFCVDYDLSQANAPIFNRITGLRDSWARASRNSQ